MGFERAVWRRGWDDGWTAVTSRVPGVTAAVVAGAVVGQLVPSNGSIWSRVLLSVVFALAAFAVVVLVSFAVSLRRVPYKQRDEARLELAHERTLREQEPDAQQVAAQKALDQSLRNEVARLQLAEFYGQARTILNERPVRGTSTDIEVEGDTFAEQWANRERIAKEITECVEADEDAWIEKCNEWNGRAGAWINNNLGQDSFALFWHIGVQRDQYVNAARVQGVLWALNQRMETLLDMIKRLQ